MIRVGSLFSGSGMLDVTMCRVLGGSPAWFCEHEPPTEKTPNPTQAAAKVLAHHFPDVPNHGDVTRVDWATVEPVQVLTGGFPCTDVSSAGKRAGLRPGTRSGLWSHMAYAISQLRPELVIIENVRGLLSTDAHCDLEPCSWCVGDHEGRPLRALGCVLGDLANLGYVGRWHGLRASDVGAPHERFRVFIAAWPAGADSAGVGRGAARWDDGLRPAGLVEGASPDTNREVRGRVTNPSQRETERRAAAERCSSRTLPRSPAPDPEGVGWCERGTEPAWQFGGLDVAKCGDVVHSTRSWVMADGTDVGPAIHRWETILGRAAPDPTVTGQRGGQQLSPLFDEFLMGWPLGWVTGVPSLSRNDQIRICGNGVVPHQAEAARRSLLCGARERAA